MTQSGNSPDAVRKTQAIKTEFARVLSEQVRSISGDPKQMRQMVYELARIKLIEQFTHEDARGSRGILQILEDAVRDVEHSFERNDGPDSPETTPAATAEDPASHERPPLPPKGHGGERDAARPSQQPNQARRTRRSGVINPIRRLAVAFVVIALAGAVIAYLPDLRSQFIAPSQRPPAAQTEAVPGPHESQTSAPPAAPQATVPEAAQTSAALPTTFGVYALSEGQLQELKPLAGKIPDRRVAISAAMTSSNAATVASGDVKFIVFRPDIAIDASGAEVRVMAKVSRTMGVDGSGKAAMVNATGSWVIRSMSFPYKAGPVDDQPRMFSLQPENEGFTLPPGRYALVVKGVGYDFTIAGDVTDPNQCVERINATNGGFYSPCPPRH
jgi:hypothetical protein